MRIICQHKGVYLVLLNLNSAFNTVHHEVLFKRLIDVICVKGNVLKWIQSYLSGKTIKFVLKYRDPMEPIEKWG